MGAILMPWIFLGGCAPTAQGDPYEVLAKSSLTGSSHLQAIESMSMDNPEAMKTLDKVMWQPGFTVEVREAALDKMAAVNLDAVKRSIRQHLPPTTAWAWKVRVCEIIAEQNWVDLTPALVSSWSRPTLYVRNDLERPEYKALAKMVGPDNVTDAVFQLFVESRKVSDQALRARAWDMLHRLGQRERLVILLTTTDPPADDAMLLDLHAAAKDLGLVPWNHEEILWLRKLREPSRAEFWSQAVHAVQGLPADRRIDLELRDLPIIVSASLYDPELLAMSKADLYARVDAALRDAKRYVQESNFEGYAGGSTQRLFEVKAKLTWGDLAATMIAIRATQVPEVVVHLFNYAERDQKDTTTEYGGVIALDAKDRFEVLEFPPAMRGRDQEYISSQAMLDKAYTSIFHFHMHVQIYNNDRYAGPGFGDSNYADNTRANCLVFTFINQHTLNVDFYRHDRVVVDLGVIKNK